MCVAVIYHAIGRPSKSKRLPVTLENKVAFMRSAHEEVQALSPYKWIGLNLAKRFEEMREPRTFFAQGTPSYTDRDFIEFTKLRPDKHFHRLIGWRSSIRDIKRLGRKSLLLTNDTVTYVQALLDEFVT